MTKEQIIKRVKSLKLPPGSYIVFGSAPLAVAGIREAQDIDLLVSPEQFEKLREVGWQVIEKGPNDKPLVFEDFEAHPNWNFTSYKPTLKHLLATADVIDEVPFASLEELRKWKVSSGRPKDFVDLKLMDEHQRSN